jgi:putative flippase GtrA
MTRVRGYALRLFRRYERAVRYVAVGAGTSLLYSGLTLGFLVLNLVQDPIASSAAASLLTQPVAFLAHRRFTYAEIPADRSQWARFGVVAVTTFLINICTIGLITRQGWPIAIGLAIGWVLVPISNFLITSLWVFRAQRLLAMPQIEPIARGAGRREAAPPPG